MAKIGRPSKYEEGITAQKVYTLIERMSQEGAIKEFSSFCGIEQIADMLDVHRDTIYAWMEEYPEFSYAIKRWETKRDALFYALLPSPQIKDARWIFLAKNWLGMTDKQAIEHGGKVDIKYISHIPKDDSGNNS